VIEKNRKQNLPVLGVIVFISTLVGVLIFLYINSSKKNFDEQVAKKLDEYYQSEKLKTLAWEQLGFLFQYPESCKVEYYSKDELNTVNFGGSVNCDDGGMVTFFVTKRDNLKANYRTVDEFKVSLDKRDCKLQEQDGSPCVIQIDKRDVIVNSHDAFQIDTGGADLGQTTVFENEDHLFEFTYFYVSDVLKEKDRALLNIILGSFNDY